MKAWLSATVIPMGAGIIAFLALGWWQAASDREDLRAFHVAYLALMALVAGIAGWRAVRLGGTRWAGAFAGAGAMGGVLAGFTAIHVGVTGRLRCHGIHCAINLDPTPDLHWRGPSFEGWFMHLALALFMGWVGGRVAGRRARASTS